MHELEETQVDREFLLRNAPMRAQPTAQQRPKPFHRIHMHFTQAVAIVISSELAPSMVDTLMIVSPRLQTGINAVFIYINKGTCKMVSLIKGSMVFCFTLASRLIMT